MACCRAAIAARNCSVRATTARVSFPEVSPGVAQSFRLPLPTGRGDADPLFLRNCCCRRAACCCCCFRFLVAHQPTAAGAAVRCLRVLRSVADEHAAQRGVDGALARKRTGPTGGGSAGPGAARRRHRHPGAGRQTNDPAWGDDAPSLLAAERLRYAARLAKTSALPVLISGGLHYGRPPSEAALMANALLQDFGVPTRWQEGLSRTTWENATLSAPQLREAGVRRVVLVTQAWHMQRARWSFERQGFEVIPAPVGSAGQPAALRRLAAGSAGLLAERHAAERGDRPGRLSPVLPLRRNRRRRGAGLSRRGWLQPNRRRSCGRNWRPSRAHSSSTPASPASGQTRYCR